MQSAIPTSNPVRPPLLHRLVSAGHLRYWIITSWAVALLTEAPWIEVLAWYVVTMSLGVIRGRMEKSALRSDRSSTPTVWIATGSCIAWAVAPLMAFHDGEVYGAMLAIGLLCAGYTLVFTQMRAAPKEALIVSSPYSVVLLWMTAEMWGTPGFLTLLGLTPVLGLALLIKVVITQIKDAEIQRVTQLQTDLIQELKQASEAAKAASEAKSNFLGVISHELRTPMNGVLGAAQLLSAGPLEAQERELVGIIQQSGESLLSLLNDILDITKIEAGRMEMAILDVAVSDLLRKVVGPFQAHAEAKGLHFAVTCDPATPHRVRTDPLRLAQIVQNFLSNAIKFTADGEITLAIRATRLDGDRARIEFGVSDQGMGIAEEDLSRLFQPFTQVDNSSTRRFAGTGLGLSIAKRMAGLLGGDVSVRSALGRGSTFTVALDVEVIEWSDPDSVYEAEGRVEEVSGAPRHLRVLVAEDHPVNRMVLEAFLGPAGHTVTAVVNGMEAVAAAVEQPFDLVIMDVNMPVMDGLAATVAIRQAGLNRETPIAMLSASARGEDHVKGFDAGADVYLDKPIDFGALAGVLDCALGGRAALQQMIAIPASGDRTRLPAKVA